MLFQIISIIVIVAIASFTKEKYERYQIRKDWKRFCQEEKEHTQKVIAEGVHVTRTYDLQNPKNNKGEDINALLDHVAYVTLYFKNASADQIKEIKEYFKHPEWAPMYMELQNVTENSYEIFCRRFIPSDFKKA